MGAGTMQVNRWAALIDSWPFANGKSNSAPNQIYTRTVDSQRVQDAVDRALMLILGL